VIGKRIVFFPNEYEGKKVLVFCPSYHIQSSEANGICKKKTLAEKNLRNAITKSFRFFLKNIKISVWMAT